MSAADFVPHPDGISPLYVTCIIEASVMTGLSTLCVLLRFIQRHSTEYGWDDWFILGALVFAYGFLATTVLAATLVHAGYHITGYTIPELETYMKIALANNTIYNASMFLSKASVLFFYSRIFSIEKMQKLQLRIIGAVCFGHFLSAVCGLIFAYNPIHAQWTLTIPSTSINQKPFWCASGVINIVLDLIILAIPQARVWRLQLSSRKKILLSLVFLLGGFVVVASIVRIVYMFTIDVADLTYTFAVPGIWTNVETNTSIICACLPTVYSLFAQNGERHAKKVSTSLLGASGFSSGRDRSAISGFKSTKGSKESEWQTSQISMQNISMHHSSHYVRIESDVMAQNQDRQANHSAMAPPQMRREFEVSSTQR
ncbi:hypothetical protein V2G26_013809 [Clonostachys chloroleuca]